VLLIEAGPDYVSVGQLPGDVADASAPTTEHDWGFVSEPDGSGRTIGLPRGRLIGGCSATNGAFLMRGWPDDYNRWAAAGNPGWSFTVQRDPGGGLWVTTSNTDGRGSPHDDDDRVVRISIG
jgi:choline dehydrogenase